MGPEESGWSPGGLRSGILGVVTLDNSQHFGPDRSLRRSYAGVSDADAPEYPLETHRSLRDPGSGQETAQTKTAITRASELRIR